MYRHCFCVKVTPTVTTSTPPANNADEKQHQESKESGWAGSVPPIPPARRQYSQFGQYKHQNYPGTSTSGAGSGSGSEQVMQTRAQKLASIHAAKKGFDVNNKRIQCEECRHEDYFEWSWDKSSSLPTTSVFADHDHNVLFNPGFSVGTGAVRGSRPLELGKHHFFEILMNTEVYGTDMMIGVGTDKVNLQQFAHSFVHFLGYDNESWGLSYSGDIHHGGQVRSYTTQFSQGTYVGVHIDMWAGTLEYYINRRPMGKAFTGLQNKTLYPMISSTAARSGMNLTYCRSFAPTLQLQALLAVGKGIYLPSNTSIVNSGVLPPGLKSQVKKQYWWISGGNQINSIFAIDANKENHKQASAKSLENSNPIKISRMRKKTFSATTAAAAAGVGCDGEVAGPSSNSMAMTAPAPAFTIASTSTSSATTESHPDNDDGYGEEGSPASSDSESPSRDSKRIRLRTASLTPSD